MIEIPKNDFNHQAVVDADVERGIKSVIDQMKVKVHYGVAQLRIYPDSKLGPSCDKHLYDKKAADIIGAKFIKNGYYVYYTCPSYRWGKATHLTVSKEPRYGSAQIYCCTVN